MRDQHPIRSAVHVRVALVALGLTACCFAGSVTPTAAGTALGAWRGGWTTYPAPGGQPFDRTAHVRARFASAYVDLTVRTTGLDAPDAEVRSVELVLEANPMGLEIAPNDPTLENGNGHRGSDGTPILPGFVAVFLAPAFSAATTDRTPRGVGNVEVSFYVDHAGTLVDADLAPLRPCGGSTSPFAGTTHDVCVLP